MALHATKSLLLPNIPNNAGSIAPISVFAPPGSILNAEPPFATGGRHAMGHFVTPLVYGALARAMPDRVQAGSGMMNLITFQGRRRDGRPFSTLYFAAGGYGALKDLDGWCTLPHPSNMATVPVEVWETLTHTTIESKRLLPDTGGPGQWRGGLGQEVVLRNDTGQLVTTLGMGNRTLFPARGLFGGGNGAGFVALLCQNLRFQVQYFESDHWLVRKPGVGPGQRFGQVLVVVIVKRRSLKIKAVRFFTRRGHSRLNLGDDFAYDVHLQLDWNYGFVPNEYERC